MSGEPLIRQIMRSGDVSNNFKVGRTNFLDTSGEPLIRRIMMSGDVSKNFQVGFSIFFSTHHESLKFVELLGL